MRFYLRKKARYRILARYLENSCNEKEKSIIEKRKIEDPRFAEEIEQMKLLWTSDHPGEELTTVDRMWQRFREKVDMHEKESRREEIPSPLFRNGRAVLRYAAIILAVIALPSVIYFYLRNDEDEHVQHGVPVVEYAEVNVPNGNRYSLTLSDGSRILLDAGSYLRYPKNFKNNRVIDLRGEAYFEVARDEDNPFIVRAGNAQIAVLGTTFNVRAWQETEYVKVSVEKGLVSLKPLDDSRIDPVMIEKNQFSTLTNSGHLSKPEHFEDENYRSWINNEIRFHKASVAEVLSQLKRWYGYDFVLEDQSILDEQITVHIVKTNVPDVLQIIARIIDTEIKQEGDTVYFMNE